MRRHGLREFHTYPLVSPGKDAAGVWGGSWRVSAEPGPGRFPSWSSGGRATASRRLLFDLDGDPTDWLVDVLGPDLPRPNWITWRKENLHAHVCYTLARPVLIGEQMRQTPQHRVARFAEYHGSETASRRGVQLDASP